jgi:rare lipoprotein A
MGAASRIRLKLTLILGVLLLAVACGGRSQPSISPGRVPAKGDTEVGIASWYGKKFHGRLTANGERFDMRKVSAAHKTLPFGTVVRVTDLDTKRSIKVRINDRGPFVEGRIIDLSRAASKKLGMFKQGIARVRIEVLRIGGSGG